MFPLQKRRDPASSSLVEHRCHVGLPRELDWGSQSYLTRLAMPILTEWIGSSYSCGAETAFSNLNSLSPNEEMLKFSVGRQTVKIIPSVKRTLPASEVEPAAQGEDADTLLPHRHSLSNAAAYHIAPAVQSQLTLELYAQTGKKLQTFLAWQRSHCIAYMSVFLLNPYRSISDHVIPRVWSPTARRTSTFIPDIGRTGED